MGGERQDRGGQPFSQWERGSGILGELVGVSSILVYPTEPWARWSHGNITMEHPQGCSRGVDSKPCPAGLEWLCIPRAFHGERRDPTALGRK